MRIFWKIKGTKAQHTIEYAILMTLIMAGIIITGPYVIRSWNANLKGWEDSAQVSLQDPLLEVPAAPITGCTELSWVDEGCNLGTFDPCTGEVFSCGMQQMLQRRGYSPAGCQCAGAFPPSVACTTDPSCCSPWEPDPPTKADCGAPCPVTQYLATRICGNGIVETACLDDPICSFECTSPPFVGIAPQYGAMCPGDDTGLAAPLLNSFVDPGECTDPTKCETECGVGFFALGSGTTAYCGPCAWPGIERTGCPANTLDPRGCAFTRFKPCCLTP